MIPSFVTGQPRPNPWSGPQSLSPAPKAQASQDRLQIRLTEDGFIEKDATRGPGGMELYAKDMKRINELMYEMGARDALAEALEHPDYEAAKTLPAPPNDGMPAHVRILNSAISGIRQEAFDQYASENEDFATRRQSWEADKQASDQGEYRSTVLKQIERTRKLLGF